MVIGADGHAKVVISTIIAAGIEVDKIFDDNHPVDNHHGAGGIVINDLPGHSLAVGMSAKLIW